MRRSHYWILFGFCALGWLILSLCIAPSISGIDVFFFRDPGWNLAAWGSFESAAGPHVHDLVPRFFTYYTPIVPMLFAGYASVFPRNAYAGTIFNLLLGLSAAAVALWWVLRQPPGKLRDTAAWAVALLAPAFMTYDRPEVMALMLFSAVIVVGAQRRPRPAVVGLLIALVFLAHPFAAIVAAVWGCALCLSHAWDQPRRWLYSFKQLILMAVPAIAVPSLVALLYWLADHDALARFAANGVTVSGLSYIMSVKSARDFVEILRETIFASPIIWIFEYLVSLLSCGLLAVWSLSQRKELRHTEWFPIAAGLTCLLLAILLFPYQHSYVNFIAFSIPVGLLIWSRPGGKLAKPALAMLLLAVVLGLPSFAVSLIMRVEQGPSYRAAREQPALLRASLASPDSVVVLAGDFYDFFKPGIRRMIALGYLEDDMNHFASVGAVVNCYDDDHDPPGTVIPFPDPLDAREFHMIQAAPQHLWITVFGHRVMRGQWGYGCDLYVRNSPAAKTGLR